MKFKPRTRVVFYLADVDEIVMGSVSETGKVLWEDEVGIYDFTSLYEFKMQLKPDEIYLGEL